MLKMVKENKELGIVLAIKNRVTAGDALLHSNSMFSEKVLLL